MTTYHDPYASLDYGDFQEVDPALDHGGYLAGPEVVHRGSIAADFVGPFPRQTPMSADERQQFQAVRDRLDRAMQATGVVPSTPQENQSVVAYEAGLLKALARHAEPTNMSARVALRPTANDAAVIAACNLGDVVADALNEPLRQGRLAAIKTIDQAGREITEFVGAKTWLNPHRQPLQYSAVWIDGVPQRV